MAGRVPLPFRLRHSSACYDRASPVGDKWSPISGYRPLANRSGSHAIGAITHRIDEGAGISDKGDGRHNGGNAVLSPSAHFGNFATASHIRVKVAARLSGALRNHV